MIFDLFIICGDGFFVGDEYYDAEALEPEQWAEGVGQMQGRAGFSAFNEDRWKRHDSGAILAMIGANLCSFH